MYIFVRVKNGTEKVALKNGLLGSSKTIFFRENLRHEKLGKLHILLRNLQKQTFIYRFLNSIFVSRGLSR